MTTPIHCDDVERQDNNRRRWEKKSSAFVTKGIHDYVFRFVVVCTIWIFGVVAVVEYFNQTKYRAFAVDIVVLITAVWSFILTTLCGLHAVDKIKSIRKWSDKKYVSILVHDIILAKEYDDIVMLYTTYCMPASAPAPVVLASAPAPESLSDASPNLSILFEAGVLKNFQARQQFSDLIAEIVKVDQQLKYLVATYDVKSLTEPPETLVQANYKRLLAESQELSATYNREYYPVIMGFLHQPNIFE